MISVKSLRLRCIEMLRLHVNLLSMFGLREKFDHGILVSILLLLFSVENHAIENRWKKNTNGPDEHAFTILTDLNTL